MNLGNEANNSDTPKYTFHFSFASSVFRDSSAGAERQLFRVPKSTDRFDVAFAMRLNF